MRSTKVNTVILIIGTLDYILTGMTSERKALRIAITTKPLDNWKSGSGHHLDELLKHVLDINERDFGFDFTFLHYKKSENKIYSRVRELIIPRNPLSASRRVARERFDIVHYSPLSVFAPVWGVHSKKTATLHGIEERLFPSGYPLYHRLHEYYVQPLYVKMLDGLATVSQTSREWFVKNYRIKPEKVIVTYNAVSSDYRLLTIPDGTPPEFPGIDRPFVLHISRFTPRKNPEGVMGGFAACIAKTGKDLQLVCAGKGWDCEDATRMAQRFGIADRLVTPGFIDTEVAVRLLNRAEAFLFPSWAEGFGMPNIEAMAAGCPVVTSRVFAIPEVVEDAAVTVSSPDAHDEIGLALSRIILDEGYKKTLVTRGLERCKQFDWDVSARTLLEYWKKLMQGEER